MTRDPRLSPATGDRWRTPWGTSTVVAVEVGHVVITDAERLAWEDWIWHTRPFRGGAWTFVGEGR